MSKKIENYILFIFLILIIYCAFSIGVSWDLGMEIERGNQRLKYIFFQNSFEEYKLASRNIGDKFYPAFYTTIASFIAKMFPKNYESQIWHLTNSLISVLTLFGIYRITNIFFNKKVAKIVFLLCVLNPIFFGHMAMNSKDTIAAFANVWSTYLFLRYIQNQHIKEKCNNYILLSGFVIGIGTGMRIPFIVTLMPLFLFVIIDMFYFKKIVNKFFSIKKFFFHLLIVLSISYLVTVSLWPHVHSNILTEPFKIALEASSNNLLFGLPIVLLNGTFISSEELPSYYILMSFLFKSPEFIIICYILFLSLIIINKNTFFEFKYFYTKLFLIIFIFLFPSILLLFFPYKIYDGLRLFLYLIPYFNIIPALVLYKLIYKYQNFISKIILLSISCFMIYYIVLFVKLTPYQYTYINKFNGDFSKAHEKFENDYWAISIKELVKKISYKKELLVDEKTFKIIFCGLPNRLVQKELNKLKNFKYEVMSTDSIDYDFVLMTNRIDFKSNDMSIYEAKTCFKKFKGKDIVSVKRNGLMLSTLRKKL